MKKAILICLVLLIPMFLLSAAGSRYVWRLNTFSSEEYNSGPGGPSGSSNSLQYVYDTEQPQLIDAVNVHSSVWNSGGSEYTDTTFVYNSTIDLLPDRYILYQNPSPDSYLNSEVVVKDYTDRFLSHAVYGNSGELAHRQDWVYNAEGLLTEVFNYRSPDYIIGVGHWKHVPGYDPSNRKISETRYHSADSLSWTPVYHIAYHYSGQSLPASFLVKEREPYWNIGLFRLWDVMQDYQIDSLSVFQWADSSWTRIGCLAYAYDIDLADEEITVTVTDTYPDDFFLTMVYPFTYMESISFDLDGMIKKYELVNDYDPLYPSTNSYFYTWTSEDSPASDETIPSVSSGLACYPNPFSNNLKISNSNKTSMDDISIYNIKGQLIRTWKDVKSSELTWDGKDASNQPISSGVYLIRARQGKDIYTTKVLKY